MSTCFHDSSLSHIAVLTASGFECYSYLGLTPLPYRSSWFVPYSNQERADEEFLGERLLVLRGEIRHYDTVLLTTMIEDVRLQWGDAFFPRELDSSFEAYRLVGPDYLPVGEQLDPRRLAGDAHTRGPHAPVRVATHLVGEAERVPVGHAQDQAVGDHAALADR